MLLSLILAITICNGEYRPFWNSDLRTKSEKTIDDFRAAIQGVQFSGVFSNNMILQQGPTLASLYGVSDTPNSKITLTVSGASSNVLTTHSDQNGDWKITLNSAMNAGGKYNFNVKCDGCKSNQADALKDVEFGDVYYCSGQSNMELKMHYTFSRNETYNNLNKYQNLRYFTMWEIDTAKPTYVVPKNNGNKWNVPAKNTLDSFSAPCWYFGQSLVDLYDIKTPIGLIDVAIGGTQIEQWTKSGTIPSHCKDSCCPNCNGKFQCGGLYNGMVLSFVNMTIKSYIWWQGENNMGEIPGSWYNNTGYGCMQPFMLKQWRDIWSVTPNTTPRDVPFGLVTLAAGTSEGHSTEMGAMRWAQTANFDFLPNPAMTNSFVALGHDMGDPWDTGKCLDETPVVCNQSGVPYSLMDTPKFMGPIHPRCKQPIGQRLAYAGYKILYGNKQNSNNFPYPLIAGCTLNENGKQIVLTFNNTFLNNEKVQVIPWSAWYDKNLVVENWSATQVLIGKNWQYINNISASTTNKNEVIVDIKGISGTITGIRYAYGDFMCCGNLNRAKHPCPPNQCPIKVVNDKLTLPAVPFWAQIENNKCKCFAPQTC